jgi:hypothetical protein
MGPRVPSPRGRARAGPAPHQKNGAAPFATGLLGYPPGGERADDPASGDSGFQSAILAAS